MELEFQDEGGYAEVNSGFETTATLRAFIEGEQIRISIDTKGGYHDIGLGVGLDADEARQLGQCLVSHADSLED